VFPLLTSSGYEVLTAMSGRSALEAVDRHQPDVVVLDLGLPDIGRRRVCRLIRKDHQMPVIVLSARAGEKTRCARSTRAPTTT
jgi:DNA-binding response OmpR family regulator